MALVSVCVPVSRVDTVEFTIQSILAQTCSDWELIAVGQGSFDNPRVRKIFEIIEQFSAKDVRIKYVHINQAGACRAKNAAIQAASSEIIAEIDDDVEAAPDWLEGMVWYFDNHPGVDVVGGAVLKPPKQFRGLAVCPSVQPAEVVYDPARMEKPPEGWNWISCNLGLKRNVFHTVGLYDEVLGPGSIFPAADDTDLLIRIERAGIKMGSTPKLIVNHTYGYRYGFRSFMKHQYNYAYGNGGLAAKMVLSGDPGGKEWVSYNRKTRLLGWLKPFRPHRLIRGFWGWYVFNSAYQRCLREFRVENNLLVPNL